MMRRIGRPALSAGVLVCAGTLLCYGTVLWACGGYGDRRPVDEITSQLWRSASAGSSDAISETDLEAIHSLRARGPKAFAELMQFRRYRAAELGGQASKQLERFDRMVDKVAGQKFAAHSGLFWHTSLGRARREAQATGRPILSLRMLGRLDEEMSCANSRFFRTILYPDSTISQRLRERFVLHWQPVREVPVVTIDFGSGDKLVKPLTGNSVHLVLNHDLEPIDALPGLVVPSEFSGWLDEATELWQTLDHEYPQTYWSSVAESHQERARRRRADSPLTIGRDQHVRDVDPNHKDWQQLASRYQFAMSEASLRVIDFQLPAAEDAMELAMLKRVVESPTLRLVRNLEPRVLQDTAFNLHVLQTKIDDWFAAQEQGDKTRLSYDEWTARIYSDVFLMPLHDPWLGLSPETEFVALDGAGRIGQSSKTSLLAENQ